ncbi:CsiV family protein [Microbulbifer aggregans]|uniref:CsiV family protein n=1 Tax=Microbulbifer aggregans TaxID=1769779 RepID=UPI001CFCA5B7|nr:CsiV family protein [Microbulbifer aggregans]
MTNIKRRFRHLGSALLLALCASGAEAASYAGTQFEIELVVFSREDGMKQSRESWPAAPRLEYADRWVDFDTPSSSDPTLPALLPAANQLGNKADALRRSSGYQVLFHKTWRQVLQEGRYAPQVLITGGQPLQDHHALEGSITVSVSRYLHLSTDLWLSELDAPASASLAQTSTPGIQVPRQPKTPLRPQESEEPMTLSSANSGYSTSADTATFYGEGESLGPAPFFASRVAVLQEERRLRSGELHYIDHPKLGVLIEVRTVNAQPGEDTEESLDLSGQ